MESRSFRRTRDPYLLLGVLLGLWIGLFWVADVLAQTFTTPTETSTVSTSVASTFRYDFTAATNSTTHQSVSACTGLTAAFNASVGDTSNVARVSIRACPAADTQVQDCTPYTTPNAEFTARPITVQASRPYIGILVQTAPTGGDTGRVDLVCTSAGSENTASLGGGVEVLEATVQVDAGISTFDFGAGLDVSESPENEANITVDAGEIATGVLALANGGTGANTSAYSGILAVTGSAIYELNTKAELQTATGVTDFALADGDVFTGAHDFGGASSLEIPNGTSLTTDANGELALDTDGDGGTHFSGPLIQLDAGASTAYLYPAPLPDSATEDDYVLTYDAGTKTIDWAAGGSAGGAWDDGGDPVVLQTTTKDVAVGAALINSAKLSVDGDADQVQFAIQGHGTQTANLVELENSGGTVIGALSPTAEMFAAGGFRSSVSTAPCIYIDDSDSASQAVDAQICAAATDTGNGSEDVDFSVSVEVAGTPTSRLQIDADDETRILGAYLHAGDAGSPGVANGDGDVFVEADLEVDGVANIAGAVTLATALTVPNGGTGVATLTDGGVLIGNGTGAFVATAVLTEGQLLIGDGTTDPAIAAVSGDATLASSGALTLAAGAVDALNIIAAGLKSGADATLITGTEGANGNCAQWNADGDLVDAGASCASGTGDSITVDTAAVTDPDLASTDDIDVINTSNTITFAIREDRIAVADVADGDWGDFTIATNAATIDNNAVTPAKLSVMAKYINWHAGAFVTDGVNCTDPAASQIVTGAAKQYSTVCADGGTIYGSTTLPPDLDDTADITFTLFSIRPSGSTALAGDFSYQCFGDDDAVDNTWQTGAAADDTLTTANDQYAVTTAGIDIEAACQSGDSFHWRYVIDDANHNATAAHLTNVRMAFTANPQ